MQLSSVGRCGALLIIVKIDEDVATLLLPRPNARRPLRECLRTIMPLIASARTMSTNVDEIGGALPWRGRIVMIRKAKRNVSLREQPQDVRPIPARIAEFKTVTPSFREEVEKGCKPLGINLEIR